MIKLTLIAIILAAASAAALSGHLSHRRSLAWRRFKQQHGKVYASQEEEARRFGLFLTNEQFVRHHNANASRSHTLALNHMADWTPAEYARFAGGQQRQGSRTDSISEEEFGRLLRWSRDEPLPDEWDWRREAGRVSAVKFQGACGSGWAFATTGLLEGQELAQNMSSLVPLSEQELIDCVAANGGCDGGSISAAIEALANEIGGLESELEYAYVDERRKCRADAAKFAPLKVRRHKMLPARDEQSLKRALFNYGPVAVAFDATRRLQFYHDGIIDESVEDLCRPNQPNHAGLVVGYGTDAHKIDFWIVKNSWSSIWGEAGYFRIKAGINLCGIADFATIALFE